MSDLKGFVPLDNFDYFGDDAEVSGIMLGLNSVDTYGSFVYLNLR